MPFLRGNPTEGRLTRGLGQHAKYRENQRFSLQIEAFSVARGTVDLFPYLGKPCKARQVCACVRRMEVSRQPAVNGVDECLQSDAVVKRQRVTDSMKRALIELWQAIQQLECALVETENLD